jgi:hypothetical protein
VRFHGLRSQEDLFPGTDKVELFLSDLADNLQVAASTQIQVLNAPLWENTLQTKGISDPHRVHATVSPGRLRDIIVGAGRTQPTQRRGAPAEVHQLQCVMRQARDLRSGR